MKAAGILVLLGLCASCSFGAGEAECRIRMPAAPSSWLEVLGEPSWLLVWYAPDGTERNAGLGGSGEAEIELPASVAAPVLAYPHWPASGVEPGVVRPAGAIVPFDLRSGRVALSWKGGVSAAFYRELLRADGPEGRLPERFDWPRFGRLLDSESIPSAAKEDPWRVDWRAVAVATRASGFDSRRVAPRRTVSVRLPVPCAGPWIGTSPFRPEPEPAESGFLSAAACGEPDALLSRQGILRFSSDASAWFPRAP
jgi:hypothetical protein